ncbi:hypothetical protein [Teredinibacter purpureus]|uniref:hypothetical protein n=1 Tax=Teredinibacter purpureus TaxID=2731756 RepID=UPI0005F77E63|nr:hypothetical protein [Teredinibacter purpureus]
MVDIGSIGVGLASIKTALDITKELRSIDSSLKDAEVKLKLAELIEALSDAKVNLSAARLENQELRDTIVGLESQLNVKQEVEFKNGFYYRVGCKDGQEPGPFCSLCYNDSNKLVAVSELPNGMQDFGKYHCPKCGKTSS